MEYCGIDLGKKYSAICIVDEKRKVVKQDRIRSSSKGLEKAFCKKPKMRIAIEASTKAFWVADELSKLGHEVHVVDPGRTKAIGSARIKHDRLDAQILAELCQADFMAKIHRPSAEIRHRRMPITSRDALVRSRTQLTNSVRGLLDSEGIDVPKCSAQMVPEVVCEMKDLPEAIWLAIEPLLTALEHLNNLIKSLDEIIKTSVQEDPVAKLLQTTTGVGAITSLAYVNTIIDPKRFQSSRQVSAYIGLVPSVSQTGELKNTKRGRITKCGSARLRWLLTMAANTALRCSSPDSRLKRWGLELVKRIGRKKAIVAVARKLAGILWAMWRDNKPFETRLARV